MIKNHNHDLNEDLETLMNFKNNLKARSENEICSLKSIYEEEAKK